MFSVNYTSYFSKQVKLQAIQSIHKTYKTTRVGVRVYGRSHRGLDRSPMTFILVQNIRNDGDIYML